MSTTNNLKRGFTLVEMAIIAPIVMLVIVGFISLIISLTSYVMVTRANNVLTNSVQDALARIEIDTKNSAGYLQQSMISQSKQGPSNSTSTYFEKAADLLILNTYATTKNPLSANNNYILRSECGLTPAASPLMLNIVYFVDNKSTLWRRVMAPAQYNSLGCHVWQRPSCSYDVDSTFCTTNDDKIIDNISNFYITYDKINEADFTGALTVTITATDIAAGKTIQQSGKISAIPLKN